MHTTLNKLHAAGAPEYCKRGWTAVYNHVGGNYEKPISIHQLIDAIGVQGAIWAIRTFDNSDYHRLLVSEYMSESRTEDEIRLKLIEVFGG